MLNVDSVTQHESPVRLQVKMFPIKELYASYVFVSKVLLSSFFWMIFSMNDTVSGVHYHVLHD